MEPNNTAIDRSRERLMTLTLEGFDSEIKIVDLESLELQQIWSVRERLPGYVGLGLSYSEKDDLVYVLAEPYVGREVYDKTTAFGVPTGGLPVVLALDPENGERAWVRPIPECNRGLYQLGSGASLIARATHRAALYFTCVQGQSAGVDTPTQSGIVRLNLDEGAAPQDVDFFPLPGSYADGFGVSDTGQVMFDPETDRLFVLSLAPNTPGTWVFDGRGSGYVGFVGSPDDKGKFNGINPATGHYYVVGTGWLLVVDGRATPVPQGRLFRNTDRYEFTSVDFVHADPTGNRFFVQSSRPDTGNDRWHIFRDNTPSVDPEEPTDFDALTDDVPEGPNTLATFGGGARSFGSRVTLVGGAEAPIAQGLKHPQTGEQILSLGALSPLSFGDRSLTAGVVPSLELLKSSVTGTAQALAPDDAVESDLGGQKKEVAQTHEECGEDTAVKETARERGLSVSELCREQTTEPTNQALKAADWPYGRLECSDGGGQASEEEATGPARVGSARLACDLEKKTVDAEAAYGNAVTGGSAAVSVGRSHSQSRLWRDDEGTHSETRAVAEAIQLSSPEGSVSIDRVMAKGSTRAHGQTGSSRAVWTRVIDGLAVRDASGEQLFPPEGEASCVTVVRGEGGETTNTGSCQQLVDEMNEVLQRRMQVNLPSVAATATPKGAFAGVRKPDEEFISDRTVFNNDGREVAALEAVVFNDANQKSRLVFELAALRANSRFTITQFPTFDGLSLGGGFDAPAVPDLDGAPDDDSVESLVSGLSSFLQQAGAAGDVTPAEPPQDTAQAQPSTPRPTTAPNQGQQDSVQSTPPRQETGGVAPGPSVPVADSPSGEQDAVVAQEPTGPTGGDGGQAAGQQPDSGGPTVLARSPGEAALMGGLWLLFAGAGLSVIRRGQLKRSLGG